MINISWCTQSCYSILGTLLILSILPAHPLYSINSIYSTSSTPSTLLNLHPNLYSTQSTNTSHSILPTLLQAAAADAEPLSSMMLTTLGYFIKTAFEPFGPARDGEYFSDTETETEDSDILAVRYYCSVYCIVLYSISFTSLSLFCIIYLNCSLIQRTYSTVLFSFFLLLHTLSCF